MDRVAMFMQPQVELTGSQSCGFTFPRPTAMLTDSPFRRVRDGHGDDLPGAKDSPLWSMDRRQKSLFATWNVALDVGEVAAGRSGRRTVARFPGDRPPAPDLHEWSRRQAKLHWPSSCRTHFRVAVRRTLRSASSLPPGFVSLSASIDPGEQRDESEV